MKKILLFLMALWAFNASAQDVIVKKDGSTILSKVLKITTTEVEYKKFTNQNGPTYTIPKTEVLAINYENGEKETFEEVKTVVEKQATQQQTTTPSIVNLAPIVSDQQLLGMVGGYKFMDTEQKAKKLKIVGWTVGSALVVSGGVMNIVGFAWSNDEGAKLIISGMVIAGCGVITTTSCLIRAYKLQQQSIYAINTSSLFHNDIVLNNGSSLSTGVDVLSDSRLHTQTVGLGLRYTF